MQLRTSDSLWLKIVFGEHRLVFISSHFFFLCADKLSKILSWVFLAFYLR